MGCSPWGRKESDMTEPLHFHALEKEMASHSSVLAWRIPGTGEPGGLPSVGSYSLTQLKQLSGSSSIPPNNCIIYSIFKATFYLKKEKEKREGGSILYNYK